MQADTYIPRRLDDQWKIGFWDVDVAAPIVLAFFIGYLSASKAAFAVCMAAGIAVSRYQVRLLRAEVARLERVALASGLASGFGVGASQWLRATTLTLDRLNEIERLQSVAILNLASRHGSTEEP